MLIAIGQPRQKTFRGRVGSLLRARSNVSTSSFSQAPPPQAQLMQMSMGYTAAFLLRAAAQIRVADYVAGGPITTEQLAVLTNTHAPSLYRLLRSLSALGVFSEDEGHRFSLTPLAEP